MFYCSTTLKVDFMWLFDTSQQEKAFAGAATVVLEVGFFLTLGLKGFFSLPKKNQH